MGAHAKSDTAWAIVPLKSPGAAKSRLQGGLDAGARRRLFFAMAQHVVRTLIRAPGIDRVVVVTASQEVAATVERQGALVLRQERDAGTAAACTSAVAQLANRADRLLMISGDLPLISASAVAALVAPQPPAPYVALVPDRKRTGTNALLCAPPTIITPCFGPDSFRRHLEAARSGGVQAQVIESDLLSLDIDDLDDLHELQRRLDADPVLLADDLRDAFRLTEVAAP